MVVRARLEKQEEKQRARAALLRAALQLAAKHGFASLGLREVARAAGMAPTSFYRHFTDMEELGSTVIRDLAGALRRELASRVLAAAPVDAVDVLVDATFATAARDPELMRFIIAERAGAHPTLRRLLRSELAALAHAIARTASGEERASGSAPPLAAEAVVSVLFDACDRLLDQPAADLNGLRQSLSTCLRTILSATSSNRGGDV